MKCSKCGQELEKDAVFCTACGSAVVRKSVNNKRFWWIIIVIVIICVLVFVSGIIIGKGNSNDTVGIDEKVVNEQTTEENYAEDILFFSPLSCVVSYVEKMTHGYIYEMMQMIPEEEVDVSKRYDADVLSHYEEFYSELSKSSGVYSDEVSVEVSYDECLEYDVYEFMEFIGIDENNAEEKLGIASDYLTGFQTYYIYTGVKYAGIDMNTGDISEFTSWCPADYVIIGEKMDNFYLVGELLLKFI